MYFRNDTQIASFTLELDLDHKNLGLLPEPGALLRLWWVLSGRKCILHEGWLKGSGWNNLKIHSQILCWGQENSLGVIHLGLFSSMWPPSTVLLAWHLQVGELCCVSSELLSCVPREKAGRDMPSFMTWPCKPHIYHSHHILFIGSGVIMAGRQSWQLDFTISQVGVSRSCKMLWNDHTYWAAREAGRHSVA